MPVERAADHPTFEIAGNTVTSYAAPGRGSDGERLVPYRPARPAVACRRTATITSTCSWCSSGSGTVHIGDEASTRIQAGDSGVVPPEG